MCRGCREVVKSVWQVVRPWMGQPHIRFIFVHFVYTVCVINQLKNAVERRRETIQFNQTLVHTKVHVSTEGACRVPRYTMGDTEPNKTRPCLLVWKASLRSCIVPWHDINNVLSADITRCNVDIATDMLIASLISPGGCTTRLSITVYEFSPIQCYLG